MEEFDPLPDWAFTDCEAWHRVVASASDEGLHLEVLESWRLDDGDRTRGDTMMCLRARREGQDVGTFILRGRGRAGFDLWLGCRTDSPVAEQLLNWAAQAIPATNCRSPVPVSNRAQPSKTD